MPRCTSPVIIQCKTEFDRPSYVRRWSADKAEAFQYSVVPCGKCVNCLKNKQSDFAYRIVREAKKYGSLVFVTFTYRPECLPFGVSVERVDKESGEVFSIESFSILSDSELLCYARNRYAQAVKSSSPVYIYQNCMETDSDVLRFCLSPSIKRSDFRLWLKRERVNYKRHFGKGLPAFSYCCVGEYGPNTVRPHMHCCFMGLSYTEVCRICESWKKDFGFVYIERVNCINADGTSGFVRASRYVAKYMFKGKFDNPAVANGSVEKARICCSMGLGADLSSVEKDYLLCKDIFGDIDMQNIKKFSGKKFSDYDLQLFASEFARRSVMCLDGTYFRLPRSVIRRLFYDTIKSYSQDGKVLKVQYKANPLRSACSTLVQANFLRGYFSKFEQSYRKFAERRDFASLRAAQAFAASCSRSEETSREIAFQRSIHQSKF